MEIGKVMLVVAGIGFVASQAYADCDFDNPVGGCIGTVKLLNSGGAKPSFSAEIEITSSAGACSKVTYFVNSTPYTAIIRSDGVAHESLFGTSPINGEDLTVSKCNAYAQPGAGQKNTSNGPASDISVDGAWHDIDDLGESGTYDTTLTLKETNGKIAAKVETVAYWGPDPNRRQYSQAMGPGTHWTGQRDGNVITGDGGRKYTIIDEHTIRDDHGNLYSR